MQFYPYLRTLLVITVMILILAIAGCATVSYGPPNGSAGIYVEYYRTGGPLYVNDHMTIYENRTVRVLLQQAENETTESPGEPGGEAENITSQHEYVLNQSEAQHLESLFEQSKFLELKHFYPAGYEGLHYYIYTISYRNYSVEVEETGIPQELLPVLRELDRLMEG